MPDRRAAETRAIAAAIKDVVGFGSDVNLSDLERVSALDGALLIQGYVIVPRQAVDPEEIRRVITDAYYETRNDGGTMETAADRARDAVIALGSAR